MSSSCSMELVPKPKGTAPVWAHFGFKADDSGKIIEENRPVCRLCCDTVSAAGGNTSNLISHIRKHHPKQFSDLRPSKRKRDDADETQPPVTKQPKIMTSLVKCQSYEKTSSRSQQLTKSITRYIAGGMVPIYTVENTYFSKMLSDFDPRYKLPSRKYFSETAIPGLYNNVRDRVMSDLESVEYYSCTTDMWSSQGMVPYLGLTVHYIDKQWCLQSRALETLYFPENHTADNIGEALQECLNNWGLDIKKLICFTTDNGSNIKKALQDLTWANLSCFGHNLHLAVNDSMGDQRVTRVLGRCRSIVSMFTTSWKKRRDLKEAQRSLGLQEHQLITDCPTRWGAKFDMIKRLVEQEPAIRKVLSADRKTTHLCLSWQDMQVLEAVIAALETVGEFTDILSLEKYVSVSSLRPLLSLRDGDLLDSSADEHSLTSHMKDIVKNNLKTRYEHSNLNELMAKGTFLDPKFKSTYLTTAEVIAVKTKVKEEMSALVKDKSDASVVSDCDSGNSKMATPKKKSLASLFTKSQNNSPSKPSSIIDAEINSYVLCANIDQEANTLDWWKMFGHSYPNLSILAKKYLCVPATSCSPERLFSKSGQIVSAKRTCLKPEKVGQLTFLAANLGKYDDK